MLKIKQIVTKYLKVSRQWIIYVSKFKFRRKYVIVWSLVNIEIKMTQAKGTEAESLFSNALE